MPPIKHPIRTLRKLKLALLPLAIPLVAVATEPVYNADHDHSGHSQSHKIPTPLLDEVRTAVRNLPKEVFAQYDGVGAACVAGPNSGAMGVHFINHTFLDDGVLNVNEPEALIFEPLSDGGFRMVGVEYIVKVKDWEEKNPGSGPPTLEGVLTNRVEAPNRYGLDSFYEVHVWAFELNPNGSYADWNTRVTCDKQPLPRA